MKQDELFSVSTILQISFDISPSGNSSMSSYTALNQLKDSLCILCFPSMDFKDEDTNFHREYEITPQTFDK